ncbi:hypothetical protein CUMW_254670 [Citrus unshiu]|uniref:Protein kinase domain-containing protein n=1 Tax=Citrus unshiu TaxID=55188 RepID=A0A2H5QRE1_CITUN|nr:hypothetical protein CUMW_254670 [Citrus unshiu]
MEQNKLSKYKTVGDYALKSKIGESSNSLSTVWKAEHLSSGDVVAVKQVYVEKLNKHLKSCLDCELNFLSSVNHPNIIRLFDAFPAENCIFLVVEFCAGGNLSSYIRLHGRVPEQTARKFLQQLGAGLEILNSHHIIHRDLKPENILLSGLDDDVMLKIADFAPCIQAITLRKFVDPHYTWLLKFSNFKDMMRRLICGALGQFFLSFLMATHLSLLVRNINSCKHLPFSQLIVPALHPDCVDMCLKLLSANTVQTVVFPEGLANQIPTEKPEPYL